MQVGVFGQGFHAGNVILCGVVAIGLGGCVDVSGLRYVGVATVTAGDCGTGFVDGKASATLMVRGREVVFAPSDGVVVLPGHVDGGRVVAGSSGVGADKKAFVQAFEGERTGDEVKGVFATPRCRAGVVLRRG